MASPRRSSTPWVIAILCLIGVYGLAVYLQVEGYLRLPFDLPLVSQIQEATSEGTVAAQSNTLGKIAVPVSAVDIPAYTKIRREHMWDSKRGRFTTVLLDKEDVPESVFGDFSEIVGRVLDHEKPAGYVFTEDDFYPKGTREGLVAGIPPNKMMLLVAANKVKGLFGLRPGDRFDIVRTIPVDAKGGALSKNAAGPYGDQISFAMRLSNWDKQAEVRVVVRDGVIVTPVKTRAKPTSSQSLTRGAVSRTVPIQEIYIAVSPEEAAPLSEAMAVGADVRAVIRSGHATAPAHLSASDLRPRNPLGDLMSGLIPTTSKTSEANSRSMGTGSRFRLVERVEDGQRQLVTVPSFVDRAGEERLNGQVDIVPAAGSAEENGTQDDRRRRDE